MESSTNPTNETSQKDSPVNSPEQPTVATTQAKTQVDQSGPKNYLVMMLLAVFLLPTGLARAYIGDKSGWTRFWVFIGAYILMIVPFINLIAGLVVFGLLIWGLVDLFVLRNRTTDVTGADLAGTPRDKKWAKGFFIYALVALGLSVLAFVAVLSLGLWAATSNTLLDDSYISPSPSSEMNTDWSKLLEEIESQSN